MIGKRGFGIDDVAVRNHRAGHRFHREFYEIRPHRRLIAIHHGAPVDREAVDCAAVECDVLVFGDDVEARKAVVALVNDMGLRGLAGGAATPPAADAGAKLTAEQVTAAMQQAKAQWEASKSLVGGVKTAVYTFMSYLN